MLQTHGTQYPVAPDIWGMGCCLHSQQQTIQSQARQLRRNRTALADPRTSAVQSSHFGGGWERISASASWHLGPLYDLRHLEAVDRILELFHSGVEIELRRSDVRVSEEIPDDLESLPLPSQDRREGPPQRMTLERDPD